MIAGWTGIEYLRSLAAVALACSMAWSAYGVARRLCSTTAARLAGTAIAGPWLAITMFWLLAPWHLFRLPIVLALSLGLAAALGGGRSQLAALAADVSRVARTGRSLLRTAAGWLLAAVAGVSALRALRGSISPPLGWDALTYHLLKAARFVQAGGPSAELAPDAWRYYEYYPPTGDALWAWAMLPLRSDALLSLTGWAFWIAALLGIWACARELGATRQAAALAAAAVGALPSALSYLSSAYVDVMVLAFFALGALFVVRLATDSGHQRLREAPLAAGALGLMVGVKLTAAPFFLLGAAVVLWRLVGPADANGIRSSPRARALILAATVVAATAGAPGYLRAWSERGSPVWPFTLKVAGNTLFQGDPGMQQLAEGEMLSAHYRLAGRAEFWRLFTWKRTSEGAFVNPGPGAMVIVGLALLALPGLLRRRSSRVAAIFLGACGLAMLAAALSKNMELFRTTIKAATFGRYLLPAFAAAAILGAACSAVPARPSSRLRRRLGEIGLGLAAVCGLVLAWPRGWQAVEYPALLGGLAAFATLAIALFTMTQAIRSTDRRRTMLGIIAILVASLGVYQIHALGQEYRYPLWQAAAKTQQPLFHMHRLHPVYASAWSIWQGLDDPESPHRIAVTAGWDRLGHNWYRYPLLGSRFQNKVFYLPITADGSIIDYRLSKEVQRLSSLPHWLARLVQTEIDTVVSLSPRWTVEDQWMNARPDLFTPVLGDDRGFHVAYRFDRDLTIEWLNELVAARSTPS